MSVVKEVPEFKGHFAWLWWRENKGHGIISSWVAVLVNDRGVIAYPGKEARLAVDIGGEWWSEPFAAPLEIAPESSTYDFEDGTRLGCDCPMCRGGK